MASILTKQYQRRIILVFVFFTFLFSTADSHPYHIARIEIIQNTKNATLEASMQFFIEDVELYFYHSQKKYVDANILDDEAVQLLVHHFNQCVQFSSSQKVTWDWVGYEIEPPYVWFYVQSPAPVQFNMKQARPDFSPFCQHNDKMIFLEFLYYDSLLVGSFQSDCGL